MLSRVHLSMLMPFRTRRAHEMAALLLIASGVLIVLWHRFIFDNWLTEYDIFTFFLPWYAVLGRGLSDFTLYTWNPHVSAGSPLAGDPSGGWMYWPVMVPFALLPAISAFKAMVAIQVVIGTLSTYVFTRMIGFSILGASMSTVAFAFGPFLYGQTYFATVAGQVAAWLALGLIGVEIGARPYRLARRAAGITLASFCVSQMAASWPGQGLIVGGMVLSGWLAYRVLIVPFAETRARLSRRLSEAVVALSAFGLLSAATSAAGLLPRWAANAESNIPGGDYSGIMGGDYQADTHTLTTFLHDLLLSSELNRPIALSGVVVVLVLFAPFVARRQPIVPFFGVVFAIALILSFDETPIHRAMYLIPAFESIHEHSPRRTMWPLFIAPALLAGAAVTEIGKLRTRVHPLRFHSLLWLFVPGFVMIFATAWLAQHGRFIGWEFILSGGIAIALCIAVIAPHPRIARTRRGVLTRAPLILLIVLAFVTPTVVDISRNWRYDLPPGSLLSSDEATQQLLADYVSSVDPGGAGEFLQARLAEDEVFRYVGYAGRNPSINAPSYSTRRRDSEVMSILLNGRSSSLGLEQIQGYNPTHIGYYTEYFYIMNGGDQDYHWTDPAPAALPASPLIDLLNVRYILLSTTVLREGPIIGAIIQSNREVFRNGQVVIFENPDALPRAWVVHQVAPNQDGAGIRSIAAGQVDPRTVAFVDGPLPTVEPLPATAGSAQAPSSVSIESRSAGGLNVAVTSPTRGLAVFSEIYSKDWKAYVNGERVDPLRTNHALIGVPVPAGESQVELRHKPDTLRYGVAITGGAYAVSVGVGAWAIWDWRSRGRRDPVVEPPRNDPAVSS